MRNLSLFTLTVFLTVLVLKRVNHSHECQRIKQELYEKTNDTLIAYLNLCEGNGAICIQETINLQRIINEENNEKLRKMKCVEF